MPSLVQQSTTQLSLKFLMVLSSDHVTGATGLSPTVTIRKEGGSFAAPSGAVSEIASGWYQVAANATDTNTLGDILLHATAGTADPTDCVVATVVAFNPQAPFSIKKNAATNGFMFVMTDSTAHAPKTGLTVAATRALDGGAFASTANSVTEIASGTYTVNLAATDTNANYIMLRFTATGADDLNVFVVTQL